MQPLLMLASTLLVLSGSLSALALGARVTPVEKVITLLENLKEKVEEEGRKEAATYDEFACFCKSETQGKAKSITSGQDSINMLSADIADKTALNADKAAELKDRQAKQEALTVELAKVEAQFQKDAAAYEVTSSDLSKAISSLQAAIKAMQASKPVLLSVRRSVERALVLADALSLVSTHKQNAVSSFLQVDPADPTYKYHSQGIIDTLEKLLADFTKQKSVLDGEFEKAKATYVSTKKSLEDQLTENKAAMESLESDITALKGEIAKAREDLVNVEGVLKDDQLYLTDLTKLCEKSANEWDQRTQLRASELEALAGALDILKNKVSPMDEAANKRALLLERTFNSSSHPADVSGTNAAKLSTPKSIGVLSFLQGIAAKGQGRSFLASVHRSGVSAQARQEKVVVMLRETSSRIGSEALAVLAMHVAADPFAKVKTLIQNLIERLLQEATQEATKKGWCDESLGKAEKDRDYRLSDVKALNVELESLEAKEDELTAEIAKLKEDLTSLRDALAEAEEIRKEEKAVNVKIISDGKEGLVAVTEAITILKSFYKQAAKATVLVQASPVDEDTKGPGFGGAYKGKQEASTGIIGMLEVIKSDFERTIRTTEEAEAEAAAEFVQFDRTSRTDISGKETKQQLDEEDLETTKTTIKEKMTDLSTAQSLLDSALEVLESLKPTCIDTHMSYADRVQKRNEEIVALKKALCLLDPEQTEPECQD